jgi:hypothetical protein
MKKTWLVFGILLIFVGFIVGLYGNSSKENVGELLGSKESSIHAWSVTLDFNAGQMLKLGIAQGQSWIPNDVTDEFKVGGQFIEYLPVMVTITAPTGHNTTFEVEYRTIDIERQAVAVFIVKVLQKNAELKLESSNDTWTSGNNTYTSEYLNQPEISGIVELNGWYTATVSRIGLPTPPTRLTLFKYKVEIVKDQWFLIPIGGTTAILGGGISVWSTKSKTHKKPVKLKK